MRSSSSAITCSTAEADQWTVVAAVRAALAASSLTASCDAGGVVADERGDIVDPEVVGLAEQLLVEPPCPSARAVDDEGFGESAWARRRSGTSTFESAPMKRKRRAKWCGLRVSRTWS